MTAYKACEWLHSCYGLCLKAIYLQQEVFILLILLPGRPQVDFGEADIYLGDVKTRIHYFCMHLPHSDDIFVKAHTAETTDAFLDNHVSAFTRLGGVPFTVTGIRNVGHPE